MRRKAILSKTPTSDNTLHLQVDEWLFVRVLHKCLDLGACQVTNDEGGIFVTAPTLESAKTRLGLEDHDGESDLTQYGHAFIKVFAPIAFKWEIYDTARRRLAFAGRLCGYDYCRVRGEGSAQ